MSARFSIIKGVVAILVIIFVGWWALSYVFSDDGGKHYSQVLKGATVGPSQCIENVEEGQSLWASPLPSGDYYVKANFKPRIVEVAGQYVDRDRWLDCLTASEAGVYRLEDMAHYLQYLYFDGRACRSVNGEIVPYKGSDYSVRDTEGVCMSESEVTADRALAEKLIAEVSAMEPGEIVTFRCELSHEDSGIRAFLHWEAVLAGMAESYEHEVYIGMPQSFSDAVDEWCGGSNPHPGGREVPKPLS